MRKLLALGLGLALAASLTVSAFAAGPTRALVQELGTTLKAGEVNLDLNAISTANVFAPNAAALSLVTQSKTFGKTFQANFGAFGGEVRVSNNAIGYKANVGPAGLAVYGDLSYLSSSPSPAAAAGTQTGNTNITVGAAYTMPVGGFILNINPEYVSTSPSGLAAGVVSPSGALNVNAAALFPVNANLIVGGELLYSTFNFNGTPAAGTVNAATTIALGARYVVNPNVTVDAVVFSNTSTGVQGGGVAPSFSTIGTPVLARVNIAF
jgi:hypothetical protein